MPCLGPWIQRGFVCFGFSVLRAACESDCECAGVKMRCAVTSCVCDMNNHKHWGQSYPTHDTVTRCAGVFVILWYLVSVPFSEKTGAI
jgi:hypothetical protein